MMDNIFELVVLVTCIHPGIGINILQIHKLVGAEVNALVAFSPPTPALWPLTLGCMHAFQNLNHKTLICKVSQI